MSVLEFVPCLTESCCLGRSEWRLRNMSCIIPPTHFYQQLRAAETACHVMSAKESDERLQRLSTFISMRCGQLANRASRLAGRKPNVRKRREKGINPAFACLLRLSNIASHGVRMTRNCSIRLAWLNVYVCICLAKGAEAGSAYEWRSSSIT